MTPLFFWIKVGRMLMELAMDKGLGYFSISKEVNSADFIQPV